MRLLSTAKSNSKGFSSQFASVKLKLTPAELHLSCDDLNLNPLPYMRHVSFASLEQLSYLAPSSCPHLLLQAIAGPMAAATASTITNPMDVVRARVQVSIVAHIYKVLLN